MLIPFPDLTLLDIPIGISPQIVMAVVTVLMISFLLFCFLPALVTWWRLKSVRSKLNKIHREKQNALIEFCLIHYFQARVISRSEYYLVSVALLLYHC